MDREEEKKYKLDEYSWHILNNLGEFNEKPDLIRNIHAKMVRELPNHPTLAKFYEKFKTGLDYYETHREFPDILWFEVQYARTGTIKRTDDEFSIKVYEDFVKSVDQEILKLAFSRAVNRIDISNTDLNHISGLISSYQSTMDDKSVITKDDIFNMYDKYSEDYQGIKTGIEELDDVIGVLGYQSIVTLGAPSGHGKSTCAINIAYNVAVNQGKCVDYISYEVPKEHIWFNLVSLHSERLSQLGGDRNMRIKSCDLKEATLNSFGKQLYREIANDLLMALKKSGGYINVIDQTTASVETFEALLARLDRLAVERAEGERGADLIIVDNVDNFSILKSDERDDMVKVNNYIIKLDAYSKKYHKGKGCAILLLTQVNRGGFDKLSRAHNYTMSNSNNSSASNDPKNKPPSVDYTVFQRFNALYEKSTCCLVAYSPIEEADSRNMYIYTVKLRNRPPSGEPIMLNAFFEYSALGSVADYRVNNAEEAYELADIERTSAQDYAEFKNAISTTDDSNKYYNELYDDDLDGLDEYDDYDMNVPFDED